MSALPALVLQLVAITHTTAIDPASATRRRDVNILVEGRRIVMVGPAVSTEIPAGARTLDGRGKFVIPALWDMHVHTVVPTGRALLALYVANGVTSVRDMAGDWPTLKRWRREIESGELVGPRIIASGPYLEGRANVIPHIEVHTPEEATRAVDSLARMGVDFVKVHSAVPADAFFAAVRAARAHGLALAGHLSPGVSVVEASDSGQRSLEHLLGFTNRCTAAESVAFASVDRLRRTVFGGCTTQDQASTYAHLARNGTWVTPTLTASYEFAVLPKRAVPLDSLSRYVSDSVRGYLTQIFDAPPDLPADADVVGRRLFAKRLETVGALFRAGVPILAGTDAPMRNSPPGFGLHEELVNLVRAGLSPLAALRTATYEPARYFDATDSLGRVAPGKLAELVVLDADPAVDIRNTRRIAAVLTQGRVYDRPALHKLLADVERSARGSTSSDRGLARPRRAGR